MEEEISLQSTEKEKLKEMDEVIEVCRMQLQSFDSINQMSHQVIERLERNITEYKYELD